jgi:hypothetical protein
MCGNAALSAPTASTASIEETSTTDESQEYLETFS